MRKRKNNKKAAVLVIAALFLCLFLNGHGSRTYANDIKTYDILAENPLRIVITKETYEPAVDISYDGLTEDELAITMMAQTVYGEANGLNLYEKSLVCWCILNRVDSGLYQSSVPSVITAHGQFHGYSKSKPVTDENYALAKDVYLRWQLEKLTNYEVGRTLPKEFLSFYGDGKHNYFKDRAGRKYDFSFPSPY